VYTDQYVDKYAKWRLVAIEDTEQLVVGRDKPGDAPRPHGSSVDRVYEQIKAMAITFQIRPGDRLNEAEFARAMNVSRTPLREALNRLVTEGFLTVSPSRGFFSRSLDAKEIFDLYEYRGAIETSAFRLAVARATDDEISELAQFVRESRDKPEDHKATELLQLDELFHLKLAVLSRNEELLRAVRAINAKIHFVRWVDMRHGRRAYTQGEHLNIVVALMRRDTEGGCQLLTRHIGRRLDQIVEVIKTGFAEIYMREPTPLPEGSY
jgi:DNA-binding GntR family transcriptional regulator